MHSVKRQIYFYLFLFGIASLVVGSYTLASEDASLRNVDAITATYIPQAKTVLLSWKAPKGFGEVILAKSRSPIDTIEKLYKAESLGRYSDTITQFMDEKAGDGNFFYAVYQVEAARKKNILLLPDRNFTTQPANITSDGNSLTNYPISKEPEFSKPVPELPTSERKKPEPTEFASQEQIQSHWVQNLSASNYNRYVKLDWKLPKTVSKSAVLTVYKSLKPLSSLPLFREAEKLAELPHDATSFIDQDLEKSQTLFYGVSIKENGREYLPLIAEESFTRFFYIAGRYRKLFAEETPEKKDIESDPSSPAPEVVKNPDSEKGNLDSPKFIDSDLESILDRTYRLNDYPLAISELEVYALNEPDPILRGRAFTFLGLSNYKLKNYESALEYFLQKETEKYNKAKSSFWIQKCLSKLPKRKRP